MEKYLFFFVIVFCAVTHTNSQHDDAERISRILNGRPATENQFPFMVSLQRLSDIHSTTRGHRCGGVLITLQHALTAAYCTLDFGSGQMKPIDRDEYRVFAGSRLLNNDTSADRVRRIANTTAHPEYNATVNFYVNNIAVIILGTPFSSNTVAQVTIRDIGFSEMSQGTIVGWGRGTQLMHAPMMAPNETLCRAFMGPLLPNMLCGWSPNVIGNAGHAGCGGDIGGPFICEGGLAGLIVDTRGCSTTTPMPHWYVRVSKYTSWIDGVVGLPIPPLGPEPTTVPPPSTTPAASAALALQPGLTLLAGIAVAQILSASVMN